MSSCSLRRGPWYGSWPLRRSTRVHWYPSPFGISKLRRATHLHRQTKATDSSLLPTSCSPPRPIVLPYLRFHSRPYRKSSSSSSGSIMSSNDDNSSTLTLPHISSPIPAPLLYYDGNLQHPTAADPQHGPYPIINPSTSETLTTYNYAASNDIDKAISSAIRAFPHWRATPASQRARILFRTAAIIRERADDLARLETLDTGRSVSETSSVDIPSGAEVLEYYAGLVASGGLNGETVRLRQGAEGEAWMYRVKEPLGVCAAIGAWNYPLQMYVLDRLSYPYSIKNHTSHEVSDITIFALPVLPNKHL